MWSNCITSPPISHLVTQKMFQVIMKTHFHTLNLVPLPPKKEEKKFMHPTYSNFTSFHLPQKPVWIHLCCKFWGLMCDTWCKLTQALPLPYLFAYVCFFMQSSSPWIPPLTLVTCQHWSALEFLFWCFFGSRLISCHTTQGLAWQMVLYNTTHQ